MFVYMIAQTQPGVSRGPDFADITGKSWIATAKAELPQNSGIPAASVCRKEKTDRSSQAMINVLISSMNELSRVLPMDAYLSPD